MRDLGPEDRMPDLTLVIANKAYSTWSLRAWLALKLTGAPFREEMVPLDQPETRGALLRWSPAGLVPVLIDGGLVIWDSLAIIEYLAEGFPDAGLWPADRAARARARAIVCEMHAGFAPMRRSLSMNLKHDFPDKVHPPEALAGVERMKAIWREALAASGGPWLFGAAPSAADCAFAPVVLRFRGYGIPLDPVGAAYVDRVLAWAPVRQWIAEAEAEPWDLPDH
jgi:glutathione S-transferase